MLKEELGSEGEIRVEMEVERRFLFLRILKRDFLAGGGGGEGEGGGEEGESRGDGGAWRGARRGDN